MQSSQKPYHQDNNNKEEDNQGYFYRSWSKKFFKAHIIFLI